MTWRDPRTMIDEFGLGRPIGMVDPSSPEARCGMTLGHIEPLDDCWHLCGPGNAAVTLPNAEPVNMLVLGACQEG